MTIKDQIERCLKDFPETRNSDSVLQFRVIYQYHNRYIKKDNANEWWINTIILKEIKENVCKRYRAIFNAKGLYMPTSQQVLELRGLNEKKWRNITSPSNPAVG